MSANQITLFLICNAVLVGCGVPREIPGGTAGLLHTNGQPLADVLVSVYRDGDPQPSGTAITDRDGHFELRTREPVGPLVLSPGIYRFTVQSVGEVYLIWPSQLADPVTTPLKQTIASHDETLSLDVPQPRIIN